MILKTSTGLFISSLDDVTAEILRALVQSDDLKDNWLAYEVLTEKPVSGYIPSRLDAEFLLEYLLACITADLGWDREDDVPHNKSEALWELTMPMVDIWKSPGTAMPPDVFWQRITRFLLTEHGTYDGYFVTLFLEGCEFDEVFCETMRRWRKMPDLKRYVDELVKIVGNRF